MIDFKRYTIFITLVLLLLFITQNNDFAKLRDSNLSALDGFVRDIKNRETLIGAAVYIPKIKKGAYTNRSGFYSITDIPNGKYKVQVSYLGYKKEVFEINFKNGKSIRKDFEISPIDVTTEDVVVTAEKEIEKRQITVSKVNIPVKQIKSIRIGGESDVFRTLQLLPGVLTSSQVSSGLYIRGGSPDQNLVLLDGSTVYNPTHLFGFVSSFNSDAIKDVELIKGAYPAEYGSRLSSVLLITQRDGNRNNFEGTANLGLISSKLSLNGPLGNGSWFIGGRRTYLDLLKPLIDTDPQNPIPDLGFYDLNGKITQYLGKDDIFSLSGFLSHDNFDISGAGMDMNMYLGNRTGSFVWKHIFSSNLFSSLNLTGSYYESGFNQDVSGFEIYSDNSITDYTLKQKLEWFASDKLTFKTGVEITNYIFSYVQNFTGEGKETEKLKNGGGSLNIVAPDWNYSLFAQANYQFNDLMSAQAGLRSYYWDKSDHSLLDPRLSVKYQINEDVAVKASWGIFHQYLRLASLQNFTFFDTWLPTDNTVKPSKANHYILSFETKPFDNYDLNFDFYYKSLNNISELNMNQIQGTQVGDFFFNGDGEAYGFEVFLQKKIGKLTGWIGYAFGFVNVQFDSINGGNWFHPKYDRRNDFKFVLQYKLNNTWDFGANFVFQTGQPYTQATSRFQLFLPGMTYGKGQVYNGDRYNLRLPPTHQLNISATYHYKMFGLPTSLILDIYNVYNRRDILFRNYNVSEKDAKVQDIKLLPIIPSVSIEVKF